MATPFTTVEAAGKEVKISNPDKVFFPSSGATKLDLVRYYLEVAGAALRGCYRRPTLLYRFPNGVDKPEDAFYQKRVPKNRPEWLETATIRFPSGRSAEMLAPADEAHLLWAINLGCLGLDPWPVRSADVDHPDELRVDLDPTPDVDFGDARRVATVVREVLDDLSLTGYPKTSGKRGIHIYVRIEPRWSFTAVRRAALALAREVERRTPSLATTAWWKEERHGVFVDFNQNARDRTIACAYSVRPTPDARVSCPIAWDEVPDADPRDLTMETVPSRLQNTGDPNETIDDKQHSLESLLELADKDEKGGLGDAPWPPHFPKGDGEPIRAQPSRRRAAKDQSGSGKT